MSRIWKKTTSVLACILAGAMMISISGYSVANANRGTLDGALGTSSWKISTDTSGNDDNLYPFKPLNTTVVGIDGTSISVDTSNLAGLFAYEKDVSMRAAAEGAVLLKNNGVLPLTDAASKNVTLLGSRSYSVIAQVERWGMIAYDAKGFQYGGLMGSVAPANLAVDFTDSLREQGFTVNETVERAYEAWIADETHLPDIVFDTSGYSVNESTPADIGLDSMKSSFGDTAIVTIGRPARENGTYLAGAEGKADPSEFAADKDVLGLSNNELATLQYAKDNFKNVVVVINAVVMDIPELEDYADAILWVGMPGVYGLGGIARLLDGTLSPSGKLSDTYAAQASNSIAMVNQQYSFESANGVEIDNSLYNNEYYAPEVESIYTGYKYYETRYYDTVVNQFNARAGVGTTGSASNWNHNQEVVYPYGFGLSYTSFTKTFDSLNVDTSAQTITAKITVTNSGSTYSGKEVVELYVHTPYTAGGIEKAAVTLVGFAKTEILAPGQSQQVTITADFQDFASWDDTLEHHALKGAYVLEAGDYAFTVGNGANDAVNNVLAQQGYTAAASEGYMTANGDANLVKVNHIDRTEILYSKSGTILQNQMDDMDPEKVFGDQGVKNFSRSDWQGNWPKVYSGLKPTAALKNGLMNEIYTLHANGDPSSIVFGADNGLKYTDLKPEKGELLDYDDPRLQMFVEQYDLGDALAALLNGDSYSAGPTTVSGVKNAMNTLYGDDGPMGFDSTTVSSGVGKVAEMFDGSKDPNYETYKDTAMRTLPVGVVIGTSWNQELSKECGVMMGQMALWNGANFIQGPGSNTHRNAYNSRNHEYYSEDGIHCGLMMAAYCGGAWDQGLIATVKHFAFNDTELHRNSIGAYMSEQRARETELRAFQGGIESGDVVGIMMGMNRAGAYFVGAHEGLVQGIIRGEWSFRGFIETDMTAGKHDNARDTIAMGTDSMLESITASKDSQARDQILASWEGDSAIATGEATDLVKQDAFFLSRVQEALKHITWVTANSNYMNGVNGSSKLVRVNTSWDNAFIAAIAVSGVLFAAALVGNVVLTLKKKEDK